MRKLGVLAVVPLVIAACGHSPSSVSGPNDVLFLRGAAGIQAVSVADGRSQTTFPGGAASPDFSLLATTRPGANGTIALRVEPDGSELTRASVPGDLVASVVSPSGDLVALNEPRGPGATPYVPAGRTQSRIVVLEPSGDYRDYTLDGNFVPEAFSRNDGELFMIEYVPAQNPQRYRVRRLLLGSGRVAPIGRLKVAAPGQMQGTGRTQVYAPDESALYTLYTQQDDPGHDPAAHAEEGHAFVHMLNLAHSWAHCIDLPHPFGGGIASASALAIGSSGSELYVIDWSNGAIAVVMPRKIKVDEVAHLAFGEPDDETFAALDASRLYVAGNDSVVVVDRESLSVVDRFQLDQESEGLALSPDTSRLYVSTGDDIVTLDVSTGDRLGDIDAPGNDGIEHVSPAPSD